MDEIAKEFYSQYGLAMNYVHVLETGILELYAMLNSSCKRNFSYF